MEDCWEDILGGILWEEFFVYIGIDLFVKILVFVKILSKSKEEGRILILRSASASILLLKRINFVLYIYPVLSFSFEINEK